MTTTTNSTKVPFAQADRFYINGEWVRPSSDALIGVISPGTEELSFPYRTGAGG